MILEEINRSGANSGACHAQMYIMGTLLRHGSDEQKQHYLPQIASRRAATAVVRRHRADDRHRHDEAQDVRRATRRPLRRERAEGVDLARPALRPDAAAGAHDAARRREEEVGRAVGLSRRSATTREQRGMTRAADPQHGEPRDQRSVLRQLRGSGREPDRRGRARAFATSSTA